jgi:hypothetical protein
MNPFTHYDDLYQFQTLLAQAAAAHACILQVVNHQYYVIPDH